MKKIHLSILSILTVSGMANATFSDVDASGGWSQGLDINGTITNTNPVWRFQIPDETITGAKNWDVQSDSGVVSGNNINFTFSEKNLVILQGVTSKPVKTTRAGYIPTITFGSGDGAYTWDTNAPGTPGTLEIITDDTHGRLILDLNPMAATQFKNHAGEQVLKSAYPNSVEPALQLLISQPYYSSTYNGPKKNATPELVSSTRPFGFEFFDVSSALEVGANNFNLTYPTTHIPETWNATIPIAVTMR